MRHINSKVKFIDPILKISLCKGARHISPMYHRPNI
jgi:hypothetical protein